MKKITPHLWFNSEAKEAAEFYTTVFPRSSITHISTIHDTPSGDCDIVSFEIAEQPFMAISAGPLFTINPAISFIVNFDPSQISEAREQLQSTWEKLSEGGNVLMPLQTYPFSELFGWVQDAFGVSWQLMLTNPTGEARPFIVPHLLFTKAVAGKAEEAIDFYCSVFKDGHKGMIMHYPADAGGEQEGSLMFGEFSIRDTWLSAMDSNGPHDFTFTEAVSLLIPCQDQAEMNYYYEHLSAVKEAEQCGWIKDKYGVSWQVWPTRMAEMMAEGTKEQIDRVTQAFLPMKRFDLAALERAYAGE